MTLRHQSGECIATNRLVRRCRSMGLIIVSVACDCEVTLSDSAGWLEHLIAESPVFSEHIRGHLPTLSDHPGQSVELWPGLWLVSLPATGHEHADAMKHSAPCTLAILPTTLWVDGEWFTLLCEQNQLDQQAALAKIDQSVVFSIGEADRIITLLGWMAEDEGDIGRQSNDLQIMGKHLGDSYEELNMLYRLSASLTVGHPESCLLTQACQELLQVVGLRWVAVQLADSESRLNQFSGKLFIAGQPPCEHTLIEQTGQTFFCRTRLNGWSDGD